MTLRETHLALGAQLAPDDIPLHYGDLTTEYQAGLTQAILLDRTHEGRVEIQGVDWRGFLNRMSTNNIALLKDGDSMATIFTNANGRILHRAMVYAQGESALLITEPGRGPLLAEYLRKHIFFADKVQVTDKTAVTAQLAIHGPASDAIVQALFPDSPREKLCGRLALENIAVFVAQSRPISGSHWLFITNKEHGAALYHALLKRGADFGLKPSGSLTYHTLRVRAGRPAGIELSDAYIPLEVGLWDEISFNKGCYTGQEIIARMESRGKLAKTIVHLQLAQFIPAPQELFHDGAPVGTLTSSAQAPDGHIFALAVVKTALATYGANLQVGDTRLTATVLSPAGNQPAYLKTSEGQTNHG